MVGSRPPEERGFPAPGYVLEPGEGRDHGQDDQRLTLLELATTAAGIGTFDLDPDTGTLTWDERLMELFGYDDATVDATLAGFERRVHPQDRRRVIEVLERAIAFCGDYEVEYRVVAPCQEMRWVASRGRALCNEQGRTVRLLGAGWDITGRREAQDRLADILETMAVGFVATDHNWTITHVNAEAERMAGLSRADVLGRTLWDRFPTILGTDFEANFRRAAERARPVAFNAYHGEPFNLWLEVRAAPSREGLAVYFVDVSDRHQVRVASDRAADRERLLSRITEELAGTVDADEAADRLARLIVPTVADWCIVTLVDDDRAAGTRRGLQYASSWHTDPALRPVTESYARNRLATLTDDAIVVRAMRTGQPQLIASDATAKGQAMLADGGPRTMLGTLAPEAVVVLPLPGRTGPVGILTLAHGAERGVFTTEDLVAARHIAARAGLVLDNARLYRQQRDLAEGLQRSLLTPPPEPDHAQIVVRYVPAAQAAQVGGDWYDAFLQPDGATVLVIGDVIGHDTQAAAVMGQIRTIVRTIAAEDGHPPAEVLRRADRVMETLQTGTAATAVVARLEQSDSERHRGVTRLRWSNAGHPPPMVINPDGTVLALASVRVDRLLGMTPDSPRRESEVTLDRDAVVLLYTDGLVERRDQNLDDGLDRLQDTLAELAGRDLDELCDELLARMLPPGADDDVAIVAVRLHPQNKPRPPEAGTNRIPPTVPDAPPVVEQPD